MKKHLKKIILIAVGIILVGLAFFGYRVYRIVAGSEELAGKLDAIPAPMPTPPPITKGEADWPHWRGPGFDGKSNQIGIHKDWGQGLKKLWQIDYLCQGKANAVWASAVVQGNRLIVPGRDDRNDLVFCIHSENGRLIWKGAYEAPAGTSHGPGARATPYLDEDLVYTFGRSGDLVCWRLEDGKILWRKNVKEFGGQEPQWGFSTSPFILNNKVIVQGGGKALVLAFHKKTGELLWKSLQGDAGYAATMPISLGNSPKLLIYHATALSCLEPEDGKELWRVPWETKYGVNATTPVVENNIIFHTSSYDMGGRAIEARKDGFTILWKNEAIASIHSDPILIDGYLYGYSGDSTRNKGLFKCLELKSGRELWSTDQIGWGTVSFADGYLICLDLKGNLYLIQPEPRGFLKKGEIKAAIEDVNNPAWTVPVIANGKLYLRFMQRLVCYQLTL